LPDSSGGNIGDILVTPIVGVKKDSFYNGEVVTFQVAVQDYLASGGWGLNQYSVTSGKVTDKIELRQRK
jgi:hypothetical protein